MVMGYFIVTLLPYDKLIETIKLYKSLKNRLLDVIELSGCTKILILMNPVSDGIIIIDPEVDNYDYSLHDIEDKAVGRMNYKEWAYYSIQEHAKSLKEAQNDISKTIPIINKNNRGVINPSTINIEHKGNIMKNNTLESWGAIMGLVIHSLTIYKLVQSFYF